MSYGFHTRDGLFFQRDEQGNVIVRKTSGGRVMSKVTLDPDTWASVMASVSAKGDTAQAFQEEDLYPEEVLAEVEAVEGEEKAGELATEKMAVCAPVKETSPDEAIEGEGFHIDMNCLKDCLNELKWSYDTAKTFLVSQYKVSPAGTLEDVLKRLTREQAEEFVKEIQDRAAQRQTQLFT